MNEQKEFDRLTKALERTQSMNEALESETVRLRGELECFKRDGLTRRNIDICKDQLLQCLVRAVNDVDEGYTDEPPEDWYYKAKYFLDQLKALEAELRGAQQ